MIVNQDLIVVQIHTSPTEVVEVLSKHHKRPRHRNGGDEKENILECPQQFHNAYHEVFGDLTPQETHLFLNIINNLHRLSWVDIKVLRNTIKTRKKPFRENLQVDGMNIFIGDTYVNFMMFKKEKINGRLIRYFTMSSSDLEVLKHFRNVLTTYINLCKGEALIYIS